MATVAEEVAGAVAGLEHRIRDLTNDKESIRMRKIINQWQHSLLFAGYGQWKDFVFGKVKKDAQYLRMKKWMSRLTDQQSTAGFRTWVAFCSLHERQQQAA